ncbi:MAG: FG-GAP repeat protein, partial [Verrucomicrobiota bacterium]
MNNFTRTMVAAVLAAAAVWTWRASPRHFPELLHINANAHANSAGNQVPLRGLKGEATEPIPPSLPAEHNTLTGEAARAALQKSGQYESLGAAFQAARYAVEKIDPARPHSRGAEYFAANPKQQLRAWFSKDGIELASGRARKDRGTGFRPLGPAGFQPVAPKPNATSTNAPTVKINNDESEPEPWNLVLRLRAAGRTGALTQISATEVRSEGGRVEMADRVAGLTQWFENRKEGVEQGFVIERKSSGSGPLEVVMAIEGNLRPEILSDTPQGIRFIDPSGSEVIRYAGLKVWDAAGHALTAQMQMHGSEVALVIAEADAKYPITIDPTFAVPQARLTEELVANDQFGYSVAVSSSTALIGVPGDDTTGGTDVGSAYVFLASGGDWVFQAKLTSPEPAPGDDFGWSVALEGDTALIGVPYSDTSASNAGSAYVFVRSASTWTQQARLTASDATNSDYFGESVALSAETVVVGARASDTAQGTAAGAAYVFLRSGTAWTQQVKLMPGDGVSNDQFGASVAISGTTALVGKPFAGSGSVYAFVRTGSVWAQQAKLTGLGPGFGRALALSGNTAIIGVPDDSTNNRGTVQVFVRTGSTWAKEARLVASDGGAFDYFGCAVAISGNTALVGAYFADTPSGQAAGSAYVFTRTGTTWSQQARLNAANGRTVDLAGFSVALSGTTALVGAPFDAQDNRSDAGRVYVFSGSGSAWSQQDSLTANDNADLAAFGNAIAFESNTAIIGAPADSTPASAFGGSAYVLVRNGSSWSVQAKLASPDGALLALSGLQGAF